ncbi:MAG: hypothetical protein CMM96_01345 [Rickettsiales bacterium]|nr:hypothetical protein [Rickettsiales bacterium]|tara:strand:- start:274 stop:654 length:381 start_codon:yes stop_codon:yes gene_type:complete
MNKNNRKVRVSELIKRELGTFFQNFAIRKNEKEYFYLTITEVDISKDLRNAIVYFSPYFPDKNIINQQDMVELITTYNKKIKQNLSKLNLRYLPKLHYKIDNLIDKSSKIDILLNSPKVIQDLQKP